MGSIGSSALPQDTQVPLLSIRHSVQAEAIDDEKQLVQCLRPENGEKRYGYHYALIGGT